MSARVKARGAYLLRFLFGVLLGLSFSANAMTPMSDTQLSSVSGQALLFSQKTVGTGTATTGSNGITFYKMGLDGTVDINTNINHLRLGCGGINGTGNCDISIDNMALSGGSGPGSDATLTRPYVQLAIANDGTINRQVLGFQFAAESTTGLLTTGVNGPTANGINVLSGFMIAQSASSCPGGYGNGMTGQPCIYGTAQTAQSVLAGPGDPQHIVLTIDADVNKGGTPDIKLTTQTNPYAGNGITLTSQNINFAGPPAVVNGVRLSSTSAQMGGDVPKINMPYTTLSLKNVWCSDNLAGIGCGLAPATLKGITSDSTNSLVTSNGYSGSLTGLKLSSTFTEKLGFIHKISVNNAPFSLSFQKQAVLWPGSYSGTIDGNAVTNVAQPGWWMGFNSPVDLGQLNPQDQIDLSTAGWDGVTAGQASSVYVQVANLVQSLLSSKWNGTDSNFCNGTTTCNHGAVTCPVGSSCGSLQLSFAQGWGAIVNNGTVYVVMPDLTANATVTAPLNDLQLSTATQNVPTNCWGAAPNTQPCFN